jgi:hypothetical protein
MPVVITPHPQGAGSCWDDAEDLRHTLPSFSEAALLSWESLLGHR